MPLVHLILQVNQVNQMRKEAIERVVLENITKRRESVDKVSEMIEGRAMMTSLQNRGEERSGLQVPSITEEKDEWGK